jgi:hypothetical protein
MGSTKPVFYKRPVRYIKLWARNPVSARDGVTTFATLGSAPPDFYQRPDYHIQSWAARLQTSTRDQATIFNHGQHANRLLQETRLPHSTMGSTLPVFYQRPGYHIQPWAAHYQTSTRDQATTFSHGHHYQNSTRDQATTLIHGQHATRLLPETRLPHSTMGSTLPAF